MISSSPLLLITGASGYIGSHIVQQALDARYSVRAIAIPGEVDALKAKYAGKVDVVGTADITTDDYTEAMKDVHAIVHLAAVLPGKAGPAESIKVAVDGTLNILRQGAAHGIKKIVVTSSVAAVANVDSSKVLYSGRVLTENDWNPSTKEEALKGDKSPMFIYGVSKTLAEREVWKFADEHPEIDITSINPVFCYGPFAPGAVFTKDDISAVGVVGVFYRYVFPPNPSSVELAPGPQAMAPIFGDVRDVARAHILALDAPETSKVGRKRILTDCTSLTWWDVVKYLHEARPELKSRLPKVADGTQTVKIVSVDSSKAKAILGIEFTDWRKTVEDTVNFLLDVEESWANPAKSAL